MRLLNVCLVGLLSLLLTACAGVDVQGVVRDAETDDPVSGATVRIGDDQTTTDPQGYYDFEVDDDDEAQRVAVSAPGYQTHTELTTIRDEPKNLVMDFQLQKKRDRQAQQQRSPEEIEIEIDREFPRQNQDQSR